MASKAKTKITPELFEVLMERPERKTKPKIETKHKEKVEL